MGAWWFAVGQDLVCHGRSHVLPVSVRLCSEGSLDVGCASKHKQPSIWARGIALQSRHTRQQRSPSPHTPGGMEWRTGTAAGPGGRHREGFPSLGPEDYHNVQAIGFVPADERTAQCWWPAAMRRTAAQWWCCKIYRYVFFQICAQKYMKSVFREHLQPVQINHGL